jgi:sec-independent protein translocase protein TatA
MAIPVAVLDIGMGQVLLIMFVVLLLFGAKKIPELAKGLGEGIKEFKKATREVHDDITQAASTSDSAPAAPKPTAPAPAEPPQKPSPPAA